MFKLNSALRGVLPVVALVGGFAAQDVQAGCDQYHGQCLGTVHFLAPSEWSAVYLGSLNKNGDGVAKLNPATGYYDYDLSGLQACDFGLNDKTYFNIGNGKVPTHYITSNWVTRNGQQGSVYTNDRNNFTCPGAGKEMWVLEDVHKLGSTVIKYAKPDLKTFRVQLPGEKDWLASMPVISFDNGATSQPLFVDPDRCGWFYYSFLDEPIPDGAIIFLDDDPDAVFGLGGADDVTPIPLKSFFEDNGADVIFMTQDGDIDVIDPEVEDENACGYGLAAVIYDTDATKHPNFSCYGGCGGGAKEEAAEACLGIRPGIVQETLGPDNKPRRSSSGNGPTCFPSEDRFNELFNETMNVNEMSCFNMPFTRAKDGKWEFDSDNFVSPGGTTKGGFYPVDLVTDADITAAGGHPWASANSGPRTKRGADGPVAVKAEYAKLDPVEGAPLIDLFCNGPGWKGGKDCKGLFVSDGETEANVWDWKQEWNGNKRNQHFCFESHSKFVYKPGQKFSFRGDDDIWVFIGGKLAVDLGGTHLASPGYVDLSIITDKNGKKLNPGDTYPIDIFFCDRRTTMSNVRIKTNMYIKQSTGLDASGKKNSDGSTSYNICWTKSGSGTCADLAMGSASGESVEEHACGAEIASKGITLKYSITNRANETIKGAENMVGGKGKVYFGGIDLNDPFNPKVNVNKITGLGPGSYRLVITAVEKSGKESKTYISFRIKGNLDVLTMNATYSPQKGDEVSKFYAAGSKWTFVNKALAGTRVPIYISAPDDQGGIDLLSAADQNYTLKVGAGVSVYRKANDKTALKTPYNGTVDSTGVDTLWITLPLDALGENPYATATATVRSKVANINFYAPKLVFAEPTEFDSTGAPSKWKQPFANDPDKDADGEEYFHWVGSAVDLYLLVLDPTRNDAICTTCSYLKVSDLGSSSKVKVDVSEDPTTGAQFVNGVAIVVVQAAIPYEAPNSAEIVVGTLSNKSIKATHGNMHFYKPPVPYPLLVEVFDTKGPTQNGFIIPEPYFSETTRYADGKADSIAIVYDRAIPEDSLPTFICLNYDEDNQKIINPNKIKDGSSNLFISNQPRDTSKTCSMTFDGSMIKKAYKKGSNILSFVADSSYSSKIKTSVNKENKVYSYAKFMWRGKESRQSFDQLLSDRMAPVIIGASVEAGSKSNVMSINLSEYAIVTGKVDSTEVFSYYLNSASQMTADKRFRNPVALNGPTMNTPGNSYVISYVNTDANPAPHLGDYIRFRADSWMWSDTVTYDTELDTLLPADVVKARADKHWNSPTNYNSTARMPSAWVMVQGASATDITCTGYGYPSKEKLHEGKIGGADFIPLQYGLDDVQKDSKYENTVGCIVKPSMSSLIDKYYPDEDVDPSTVYYQYEADYFTNLGNFVAHDEKKIFCNDKTYFPSGDCRGDTQHYNLLITWNMISDKKRLVGTGAYIAKISSFIKVGAYGKKAKQEETHVWGVRRVKK